MTRTSGPLTQPKSVPRITPLERTKISTVEVLFAGSGSYGRADTVAVLVTVPPTRRSTRTVMRRLGVSAVVTVPTVQMPVPES
jgi:hypothetical protein